ncbi:hypothetical protein ADUPG1_001707, partial [Aduncisulcus paluster]
YAIAHALAEKIFFTGNSEFVAGGSGADNDCLGLEFFSLGGRRIIKKAEVHQVRGFDFQYIFVEEHSTETLGLLLSCSKNLLPGNFQCAAEVFNVCPPEAALVVFTKDKYFKSLSC